MAAESHPFFFVTGMVLCLRLIVSALINVNPMNMDKRATVAIRIHNK